MAHSHWIKRVRIRSYSGPHFSTFGLNKERFSVSLCIQSKCGNVRNRITPNMDTFYAVYLCLATRRYSTEPRARKYVKRYGWLPFPRNLSNKCWKKLLDIAIKTGLDAVKTVSTKQSIKQLRKQWLYRKQNRWQICENKACACNKFKRYWRNHHSTRK